jgi:hypothetical protein
MKEALSALVDSEVADKMKMSADDFKKVQQEMDTAVEANPLMADPTHLTGTHDESHQEL